MVYGKKILVVLSSLLMVMPIFSGEISKAETNKTTENIKLEKKVGAGSNLDKRVLGSYINNSNNLFHDRYAKASIISDLDTGRIIYEKNSDQKYAMASMSKIMTLLITFDAIRDGLIHDTDVVTIHPGDVNREGTNIKLNAGDKIQLIELMKGMMTVSANDAALAIARYVGGSYSEFVKMMNQKAKEIGMKNTIFYNPNGLPYKINKDGVSTENTTTARDVLTLSKWIYSHYPSELTKITSIKRYINRQKGIDEPNTNPLLPIMSNVDGLKTGFTDKAGYCLSYTMKVDKNEKNEAKNRIFGVTMGAESKEGRKDSAYTALSYINKNYNTKILYDKDTVVKRVPINGIGFLKLGLETKKPALVVKKNSEILNEKYVFHQLNIVDMFRKPLSTMYVTDQFGNMVAKEQLYLQSPDEISLKDKLLLFASIMKATLEDDKNTSKSPIISIDMELMAKKLNDKYQDTDIAKELRSVHKQISNTLGN